MIRNKMIIRFISSLFVGVPILLLSCSSCSGKVISEKDIKFNEYLSKENNSSKLFGEYWNSNKTLISEDIKDDLKSENPLFITWLKNIFKNTYDAGESLGYIRQIDKDWKDYDKYTFLGYGSRSFGYEIEGFRRKVLLKNNFLHFFVDYDNNLLENKRKAFFKYKPIDAFIGIDAHRNVYQEYALFLVVNSVNFNFKIGDLKSKKIQNMQINLLFDDKKSYLSTDITDLSREASIKYYLNKYKNINIWELISSYKKSNFINFILEKYKHFQY